MERVALQCHDSDNVAVVFAEDVRSGMEMSTRDKKGNLTMVTVISDIPYGHKFALKPIHVGDEVLKYGEAIGVATKEIAVGEHVHVHNMDSQRARGDWEKEGR